MERAADVPALRETGLVDYAQESCFSLAAPAGIPAVAQEKLAQALKTVLTDPEVIESFQQKYGQAVRYEDGASYAKTVARDYQRWSAGSPANVAKH